MTQHQANLRIYQALWAGEINISVPRRAITMLDRSG